MERKLLNKLKRIVNNGGSRARLAYNKNAEARAFSEVNLLFIEIGDLEIAVNSLFMGLPFLLNCESTQDIEFANQLIRRSLGDRFFYEKAKKVLDLN